ncbi:helix-hairpin-helix domain-containing protein [Bacteroidia bacterium]|nr:helix-hairpin-helix domain-containing protein [Bacteroidia bacterium]
MRKFIQKLLNYTEISNFERGGLMVLLFSLLIFAGYYYAKNSHTSEALEVNEEKLAAFRAHVDSAFRPTKFNKKEHSYKEYRSDNRDFLKSFNPNSDSKAQLMEKGIPGYVACGIVSFRNAGGRFKYNEDVAKIYAVSDELYSKLSPYIDLPHKTKGKTQGEYNDTFSIKKRLVRPSGLNINLLTAEQLKGLPGIGEFYAKQIISYRDKLGGYMHKEQLLEVYKMRDESAAAIDDMFVYAKDIEKVKLNTATFKDLLAHPYLDYKEVKALVNYIEQHGKFAGLEELEKLHIFKGKDIGRLLPYLDLN